MKTFFKQIFGRASTAPKQNSRPAAGPRDNPPTIEDGSEDATRRQLVQVLLRDVLRRSGIPPEWIECHMLLVSSRTRGQGMYVRLVLKHWDPRMMTYTVAFQRTLMRDIERFEPKASEWLHGISWQLDVNVSCPLTELPEKSFWLDATKTPLVDPLLAAGVKQAKPSDAAHTEEPDDDDPTKDLERLFAIRDQELDGQAADGLTPVGYENTQPAQL